MGLDGGLLNCPDIFFALFGVRSLLKEGGGGKDGDPTDRAGGGGGGGGNGNPPGGGGGGGGRPAGGGGGGGGKPPVGSGGGGGKPLAVLVLFAVVLDFPPICCSNSFFALLNPSGFPLGTSTGALGLLSLSCLFPPP